MSVPDAPNVSRVTAPPVAFTTWMPFAVANDVEYAIVRLRGS